MIPKERLQEIRGSLALIASTMSEDSRSTVEQYAIDLLAAYDELASAHKILADEYAAAIRALRHIEFSEYTEGEFRGETMRGCCDCGLNLAEAARGDDHDEECIIGAVLSTPRAKEVE